MKKKSGFFLAILLLLTSGCYAEMAGVVVDAETGQPIVGAVVLVEWTIDKGVPGMMVTATYDVTEVVSDKEGKVRLSGVFNPSVNPPQLTVYKAGYVAWNSEFIFPGYKKRKDFQWGSHYVFKLERFREEYSHWDHVSFIRTFVTGVPSEKRKLLSEATAWEEKKAFREMREKWRGEKR